LAVSARLVSATIAIMLLCGQAQAQAPAPGAARGQIPLARIEAIFANLKAKGVDLSGPQPWCYFFISYDRAKLDDAAKILVTQGYAVVDIQSQPNALPDGPRVWQLEVRRVERLTPEAVFARNGGLYDLAAKVGSIYYDGLEIEQAHQVGLDAPG
jgi:hypothetical protein